MSSLTYKNSGVDITAGNNLIKRIKPIAQSTNIPGVISSLGGFGAMFELPLNEYKKPILVSATDGVGTKLKIADKLKKHDTIGIDLVAMCVNDLIVQGAKPLFFLDYYATSKLNLDTATEVISGIADGCKQANCALIGGETAEMPNMYQNEDYDLAGFCVGIVDKDKIIDGTKVKNGDHIIALASSGAHSNGYSLIRKVLEQTNPTGAQLKALIEPTKIYVKTILELIEKFNINAISHITGGGLLENIPRVLPSDLSAQINTKSWQIPQIFNWLQQQGNINIDEMYRVFNCGVGMVIIVPQEQSSEIIAHLKNTSEEAWLVGAITKNNNSQIIIK